MVNGCATRPGVRSDSSGSTEQAGRPAWRFGKVALAEESGRASFSFQKAKGKLGSAKEAIVESAELGLSGPGAGVFVTGTVISEMGGGGDPVGPALLAGAAGGVAAVGAVLVGPAVGAKGLIRSMQKVSPEELAEREKALIASLGQMAEQQPFREELLESAAEKIRGGLVWPASAGGPGSHVKDGVTAILEAHVDDLRLERAGSSEGSYFLSIKTHVRVVRIADGSVWLERKAEYRSGTDLFLDWTLYGAIEGVAETGYKALAQYYVEQLMSGDKEVRGN